MGRRKVRYYPTVKDVEAAANSYFGAFRDDVINYMITETNKMMGKNFKTLEELAIFDIAGGPMGGFGLDCGWVWLEPKNKEQRHEWFLDNDRIPDYASPKYPYDTQSTTLKEMQVEYMLKNSGLGEGYRKYTRLD